MAAEWTKIHRPVVIDQTKDLGVVKYDDAEQYENRVTRIYVGKYGINRVRGGNLTYRGKLVAHFGRYYSAEDWSDIVLFGLLFVWIIFSGTYIIVDYYFGHFV